MPRLYAPFIVPLCSFNFLVLILLLQVEHWQGPVSAALMIWTGQHGQKSVQEQIADVLQAVSASSAMQMYLTLHLVFEVSVQ